MSDLLALADEIERAAEGSRELDARVALALGLPREAFGSVYDQPGMVDGPDYHPEKGTWSGNGMRWRAPDFTTSLDAARALGNGLLCVFASDIGADGQPLVKLVADTTTSPIIEHSGIAATLEMAWCAASLRAIHQGRSK